MTSEKSLINKLFVDVGPGVDLAATALGIIPGFAPVLGVVQALRDVQSKILVKKIQAFLDGATSATEKEVKTAANILDTPGAREDLSEALLLAINGYMDLYNCRLLGQLYLAFLRKEISSVDLRRFAFAVSLAFPDDIQEFLIDRCSDDAFQPYKENFQRTGLIRQVTGDSAPAWDDAYEVSQLGETFLQVMTGE